jgi:hypothetical protein
MDELRKKKLRAALVAIAYYLEEEEAEAKNDNKTNLWVRSGRETTMNNRYLVQMRNFRR